MFLKSIEYLVFWETKTEAQQRWEGKLVLETEEQYSQKMVKNCRETSQVIDRPEALGKLLGNCVAFLDHMHRDHPGMVVNISTLPNARFQTRIDERRQAQDCKQHPLSDSELKILFRSYSQTREAKRQDNVSDELRARAYNPFGLGDFRGRNDFDRQC